MLRHVGGIWRVIPGPHFRHGRVCPSLLLSRLYSAFRPSPEQREVVTQSQTYNIVVSARPGAGKTATAEAIVAAHPDTPVAIITYSKRLQLSTEKRLQDYPCADVYTFHRMAGRLFSTVAHNDTILRGLRKQKTWPVWRGPQYEIVVLDEFQDCTEELYWLTYTFISSLTQNTGRAPRIVVLGDAKQAIYAFRGADSRYLDLAPTTFSALSPHAWKNLPLSTSFRLSHANANFVNDVYLGESYIVGSHEGPQPVYIHSDLADVPGILDIIVPLIRQYGPANCAILAPHIRSNLRLSLLTNALTLNHGIPVAVTVSDDMPMDDMVLQGKVAVTTFHQFKGSERDLVIVYGTEASYFKYLGRDLPDGRCPNTIFVALTRALKQLVIVHSDESPAMPFVDWPRLLEQTQFMDISPKVLQPQRAPINDPFHGLLLPREVFVSDIARHSPGEILDALVEEHLTVTEIVSPLPPHQHINAPERVCSDEVKNHFEPVSDLNGLMVTAAFEWSTRKTMTTLGFKKSPRIPARISEQAVWLARAATAYEAKMSNFKSRNAQMAGHTFDWLVPHLSDATERLAAEFSRKENLEFEVSFGLPAFTVAEEGRIESTRIKGRADIIEKSKSTAGTIVWEIKFVAALTIEHTVQAAVYAYLWAKRNRKKTLPGVILFNVRDGMKLKIEGTIEGVRELMEGVLRAKYTSEGEIPTEQFLEESEKIQKEVENVRSQHHPV
ncbi:P-loop containing nucleoside triphosphate hydrolase protein [Mycena rosella]|uniref:P-loop containing nucleoside triphosphate hydrolase protein n=1 Tax=Mycena rosella TaxID=1033263 RepID=A0AAD7DWR4_MYCRO|nr:P-loop containing nucleoside triphosphate hydrolase protein [Mycena rosella]